MKTKHNIKIQNGISRSQTTMCFIVNSNLEHTSKAHTAHTVCSLTQYANVYTHSEYTHNLRITYIDSMGHTHLNMCVRSLTHSLVHSLAHVLQRIRYHCTASIFNFLKCTHFDAVCARSLSLSLSVNFLQSS